RLEKTYQEMRRGGSFMELPAKREVFYSLREKDALKAKTAAYVHEVTGFPVWQGTEATYFPLGKDMFPVLLKELREAKHFIFMEYFMIKKGFMWDSILEILEEKAAQGVDVRIIYDHWGCVITLPLKFEETLRAKGIACEVFNPFPLIVNAIYNKRDHRKICVIDGRVGFTGGINLCDEYIGKYIRFGEWKDTALMLKGEAVWNLTACFLQVWQVVRNQPAPIPLEEFGPRRLGQGEEVVAEGEENGSADEGYFLPFGDYCPLDAEAVSQNVYLNVLSQAQRYVYICTPYLIIDDEMMNALCRTAQSGVDVRIMTPGIPDKKLVFMVTQSYYPKLLRSGVKIYSYQPGFLHAKSFVSDDNCVVLGTINLDYRSLYLDLEDGVWLYDSPVVKDVKEDFLRTLQVCKEVTLEECLHKNVLVRTMQNMFRLFAPMF
ncbi:MAG: cardiolipin synthase, partial [Blautia sp.]|nr:cardiolipin synthase [Blautia sp.]